MKKMKQIYLAFSEAKIKRHCSQCLNPVFQLIESTPFCYFGPLTSSGGPVLVAYCLIPSADIPLTVFLGLETLTIKITDKQFQMVQFSNLEVGFSGLQ